MSKRDVQRCRELARWTEEQFESAIARYRKDRDDGKPRRSILSYGPDRHANRRHVIEAQANIARILSSARLLAKAFELDSSPLGEWMREATTLTIKVWSPPGGDEVDIDDLLKG
jgi:hypothetical protein